MQIRRPASSEADILSDLIMRSKQSNGYDDAFMDACREELMVTPDRLDKSEFWVADEDGLRGCASLSIDADTSSAEVGAFFIDPDYKRQGVGNLLWKKLLSRSREHGLKLLHLDSDPLAVPFYEKQGFQTVRQTPSGSIPGRTIPYMELHLD